MLKRGLLIAALALGLPFAVAACGDDDDDDVSDRIDQARDTVQDAANDAQSAVAGVAPVNVTLNEVNGSRVSGTAIVTPEGNDRVRVTFEIDAEEYQPLRHDDDGEDDYMEAGIWEGTCDTMSGNPRYDLDDVRDGVSTDTAGIGIQDLKDGNYVIAIAGDDFDDDDDDANDIEDNRLLACGAVE